MVWMSAVGWVSCQLSFHSLSSLTLSRYRRSDGCQSVGAGSVWFSEWSRSDRHTESGGGVGGLDGGCMSLFGLLTCKGLHLCDSCLLMLLLLGFLGRLRFSSLAADWLRSLRVSEDSSMYARFSPKKSSSWQPGEGAVLRGWYEGRTGWEE